MIELVVGGDRRVLGWDEFEALCRAGRVPPDAQVRAGAVTQGRFQRADALETWRAWSGEGERTRAAFALVRPPWAALTLAGIHLRLWTWYPVAAPLLPHRAAFAVPAWWEAGEWWRPLAYGFVHVDLMHVLLNTCWLLAIGIAAERLWGSMALWTLFCASTVSGAVAIGVFTPHVVSIGSSGGVFGLLGAVLSFGLIRGDAVPRHIRPWFGAAIAPYVVLVTWSGFASQNVANAAHLGGLALGLVAGLAFDPQHAVRRPLWNQSVSAGLAVFMLGAVAAPGWLGAARQPTTEELRDSAAGSVHWRVPAGWTRGVDASGRSAYRSPASPRTAGIDVAWDPAPTSPEPHVARWRDDVLRRWPEATIGPEEPCTVHDLTGLSRTASLPDDHGATWFCVVLRGRARLEVQFGSATTPHTDPLLERLRKAIRWDEPPDLVVARRGADPVALAAALLDAGQPDEARRALQPALRPDAPDRAWELAALLAQDEAALDEALAHAGRASVLLAAARSGPARADVVLARGILRLAAARWPKDRAVRRERVQLADDTPPPTVVVDVWSVQTARAAGREP